MEEEAVDGTLRPPLEWLLLHTQARLHVSFSSFSWKRQTHGVIRGGVLVLTCDGIHHGVLYMVDICSHSKSCAEVRHDVSSPHDDIHRDVA